jgi:hypothetical protein
MPDIVRAMPFYFAQAARGSLWVTRFQRQHGHGGFADGESCATRAPGSEKQIWLLPAVTVVLSGHGEPHDGGAGGLKHNPVGCPRLQNTTSSAWRRWKWHAAWWGTTHPELMAGAVTVEEGRVVAEGATAPDVWPHAWLALLARSRRGRALNALCDAGAVLHAGPQLAHARMRSPPRVSGVRGGRGAKDGSVSRIKATASEVLRAAGIEVITGVLGAASASI